MAKEAGLLNPVKQLQDQPEMQSISCGGTRQDLTSRDTSDTVKQGEGTGPLLSKVSGIPLLDSEEECHCLLWSLNLHGL